jgi:hypothetical protein
MLKSGFTTVCTVLIFLSLAAVVAMQVAEMMAYKLF